MNQQPLENVAVSTQVRAPHPAGLVGMRKASFQHFSAPPQQLLAVLALDSSPVAVHCLLRPSVALPLAPSPLWLRDVAAHLPLLQGRHRMVAVVALVADHVDRAAG